jgi:hypothetical protein
MALLVVGLFVWQMCASLKRSATIEKAMKKATNNNY